MTSNRNTYDPTLYQGAASYYARYRSWPKELFAPLIDHFHLDGHGRLLDVGCGTGQLAIPLAPEFEEVVGTDPDPDMLKEARQQAAAAGVRNMKWIQARAEDLSPGLGTFRLITIGSAFHWMNRARVIDTLYSLVSRDGSLAIIDSEEKMDPDPWPVIKRLLRRYVGEERRAGQGTYKHPDERHEAIVRRSRFGRVETLKVPFERSRSLEELVGLLYSTSFASRRLLGTKVEAFEREARRELSGLSESGQFLEHGMVQVIVARKEL